MLMKIAKELLVSPEIIHGAILNDNNKCLIINKLIIFDCLKTNLGLN